MILEIILGVVIFSLIGLLVYEKYENKRERANFINALIAKTPEQYRDLKLTEKVEPIKPPLPNPEPEFIHESEMPDDKFAEMIKKEVS